MGWYAGLSGSLRVCGEPAPISHQAGVAGLRAAVRKPASSHLVVLAYADEYRAAEVLATLQRLHTGTLVEARDATSVVRRMNWSVKLQYGCDLGDDDGPTVRAWRAMVAVLLPPPGEMQPSSSAGYGFRPGFTHAVNAAMPPGSSAVLMSLSRSAMLPLLRELRRFGGTLLDTPIDWVSVDPLDRGPRRTDSSGCSAQNPSCS